MVLPEPFRDFCWGLCGFVQDSDVQPDSVINMLIILATVVPAVTVLLGGVLFQVLYKVKPEELASSGESWRRNGQNSKRISEFKNSLRKEESEMEKYLDPALSPEERAEDLLGKMSLEEKVRQLGCTMVIPAIPMEYQDLKGGIGVSIVMGGKENYAEDLEAVQKHIMEQSPHHVPALFHGEALAGPVSLLGGSVYPISIGLGATFEPGLREKCRNLQGRQMLANGIRHGLSPMRISPGICGGAGQMKPMEMIRHFPQK